MKTFNSITLFILVFLTSLSAFGQRYPVQTTFMITPPYPIRLSDYAQVGNTKTQASVWLKDLSQPDLPVKLKLRIENSQKRLILETKPSFSPEPIHLVGGQTEILDAIVLGQYFELNNLTAISGSTSSIINNGGRLPDGFYKFSLEVLDFYTGRKISNTSTVQCFLVLSDPPLLVMPMDKQKVIVTDPQFLNFSWTPRHLASPNKPQNVTYRFQVVEILRDNQPAGDAFASTNPIIDEEGISVPAYQLTALDAPLFPGNKYGWRVQAYDEDENGLIKNDGWSEPRIFQFGDACTECDDFAIANTTHSRAELIWSGKIEHSTYEVRYRRQATKEDTDEIPWKTDEFNTDQAVIKPLTDNTIYEFQVRGLCLGNQKGNWSEIKTATTETKPESTYSCDGGQVIIAWENDEPLTTPMKVGEQFTAGDFDITVVEDDVNNGTHSGIGMIRIQAFNKVFFNVEWDDVTVNTDNRLIDGEALVTGSDTDIIPPELAAAIMDGLEQLDAVLAEAEATAEFIENIFDNLPDEIKNEISAGKAEVDEAKTELDNAKDILKDAKRSGNEQAIAVAEQSVETAKAAKATARASKKQAFEKALDHIKNELQESIKLFVKLANGINRTLSTPKGPGRATEARRTIQAGDELLAKLESLDGLTSQGPSDEAEEAAKQEQDAALADLVKFMGNIITSIQGNEPLDPSGDELLTVDEKWQDAQGVLSRFEVKSIPEAFEMTRTAVWTVKMVFETMYATTANDDGEIQSGEGWHATDRLIFTKADNTAYGFDTGGRAFDIAYYTQVDLSAFGESNYVLPWVAASEMNSVTVGITGATEGVQFKSADGSLTASASGETVSLTAHKSKKDTEWIAYKQVEGEEKIVGKINVQSYEPQTDYKLYIYAVNGQTLPDGNAIQTYLNNIYGQALINWTVEVKTDLAYTGWDTQKNDGKIEVAGSGQLTAYTEEQKNIIKYFRDNNDKPRGNEFVLFWSPKANYKSEEGEVHEVGGFMPLSKRYGFIFDPASQKDVNRTIAHELGHGAFALRHTWDVFKGITKGDSKNLMDYNDEEDGTEIWKWQWDLIQNPAPMVGFENEDQEGMAFKQYGTTLAGLCKGDAFNEVIKHKKFYLPTTDNTKSVIIDLDKIEGTVYPVAFYAISDPTPSARGTLAGFIKNDITYHIVVNSDTVVGFRDKEKIGEIITVKEILADTPDDAIKVSIDCESKIVSLPNNKSFNSDCIRCNVNDDCDLLVSKLKAEPKYAPFFKEGSAINTAIEKNPCILKGMYTYDEGLGYTTEFMEGINKVGEGLFVGYTVLLGTTVLLPMIAEGIIAEGIEVGAASIIEWMASEAGRAAVKKIVKDIVIDFAIDYTLNIIIEPFFYEGEITSFAQLNELALSNINPVDLGVGAVKDIVKIDDKYELIFNSVLECSGGILSGMTEDGKKLEIKDISMEEGAFLCLMPVVIEVAMDKVTKSEALKRRFDNFKELLKDKKNQLKLISICKKLGITDAQKNKVDDLLIHFGVDDDLRREIMKRFCFPAGTQIYANGKPFKAIEKITVGDVVDAYNEYNQLTQGVVTSTSFSFTDSLVTLYHQNKKLLQSTPNHPIFTPAGYKLARDFLEGDSILNVEGEYILITSTQKVYAPQKVYNFEVGELHTYFAEGILVHNSCDIPVSVNDLLSKTKHINEAEVDIFLNDLTRSHDTYGNNVIKENMEDLTDDMLAVWKVLYEKNLKDLKEPKNGYKRLDFTFLQENAGKSKDEILANLTTSKKFDEYVEALAKECSECAVLVRSRSKVRRNTFSHLDGEGFADKLIAAGFEPPKGANETWDNYFKVTLKKAGRNIFEAHHIFPVNLFKSSEGFKNYMKYYDGSNKLSFNAEENNINSIMLESFSSTNGKGVHTNHHDYEEKIASFLDKRWEDIFNKLEKDGYTGDALYKATADDIHSEVISLAKNIKILLEQKSLKAEGGVNVNNIFDNIEKLENITSEIIK
ncbi:polymorphic toxin-type HINT domain-containing protein [Flammeovirga pacifica]|uniref:Fibronectin type-III domain-containing protein n=1 Tax=Flammeovirga pacifica TaxID=915059 RepID=A0A1S1Z2K5_FLAPC|nr:polymorphic toxin-type HINT domain-containing protein [Flammeovirga pacifica]OHX67500.1 hypothetical protein NH26_14665 [Flammeovirga pacifica]